jgi:hypothetical protein
LWINIDNYELLIIIAHQFYDVFIYIGAGLAINHAKMASLKIFLIRKYEQAESN